MDEFDFLFPLFEEWRDSGDESHDGIFDYILANARNRDDLEAVLRQLPSASQVADRVTDYLGHRSREPKTAEDADELIDLARAHLHECLELAARRNDLPPDKSPPGPPVGKEELELFEAVASFPIQITHRAFDVDPLPYSKNLGRPDSGLVLTDPYAGQALTENQIDAYGSYCTTWAAEEIRESAPVGWHKMTWATARICGPLPFVHGWLCSPGIPTPFDYSNYYEIWKAGASIWLTSESVHLHLFGAYRWTPAQSAPGWQTSDPL